MKKIFILTCLLASVLVGCNNEENNVNEVELSQAHTTITEQPTEPVDLEKVYQAAIANGYEEGYLDHVFLNNDKTCIEISYKNISLDISKDFMIEIVLDYFKEPLKTIGVDNYDFLVTRMNMSTPSDGTQSEEYDGLYIMWNVTEGSDVILGTNYWEINIKIMKK